MSHYAPRARLATHAVDNQPPDYAPDNVFTADIALREAALREAGGWVEAPLLALGAALAAETVREWGVQANRFPPVLESFDRWGRRLDEVSFHPAYHQLMDLAVSHGIQAIAWTAPGDGGHVAHAAMLSMFTTVEAGVMCPISMTNAAIPVLRQLPALAAAWEPKILAGRYDPRLRPIADKTGLTLGMAMTEKQGGSDVRANTTRAAADGNGAWRLTGHKWFCSAPMSDGFLTLAQAGGQTDQGLSCFLVPRIDPAGERNLIQIMRLKDKLGNRSNASAEIEYHGAHAALIGDPGRGVATIIDMVRQTRLDTMAATLGIMRAALAEAVNHVRFRRAFQRRLIEQPVMRVVIADLTLEYEAAAVLTMRVARAFGAGDSQGFARLAVAIGKYWLSKRCPGFVYECLECLGGAGYVEEGRMPRLYREAPLNAIWEGTGNVIALDVLRTLAREPDAYAGWRAEAALAAGGNAFLDRALAALDAGIAAGEMTEPRARWLAERLALLLQAALLVRHAPAAVADAFCATRLGGEGGGLYGTLPSGVDLDAIIRRVTSG